MTQKFTKILLRRDTESELSNIILSSGEPAFALDTRILKIGDGTTTWTNLEAVAGEGGGGGLTQNQVLTIVNSGISGVIGGAPALLDTLNELAAAIDDDESFATTILNALNDKADESGIFNAAVDWTANHTLVDGTRYLAGDLVYVSGQIYKANFDNESLPVTNTTYWSNVGSGYRLNIDGRDISNIPYPVDTVNGQIGNVNITDVDRASSIVTTVFNETGSPIPKFKVVYIDGGQGDLATINLASSNGEGTSSKTYGITYEQINHMGSGRVVVIGALTGVDTDQFNPSSPHGDINGTTLWLSTSGNVTATKPTAPYHAVSVGTVVRTHQNAGVVEVKIQNGYELDELHNVKISGVAHNDVLVYNSGNQLWENNNSVVFSDNTGITGASGVNNIVKISQTAFDNLSSVDPNTIYFII